MYGFSRTGGLGDPPIPYIKLGKGIINYKSDNTSILSLYTSGSIAASQFLDLVNAYHVEVTLNRML